MNGDGEKERSRSPPDRGSGDGRRRPGHVPSPALQEAVAGLIQLQGGRSGSGGDTRPVYSPAITITPAPSPSRQVPGLLPARRRGGLPAMRTRSTQDWIRTEVPTRVDTFNLEITNAHPYLVLTSVIPFQADLMVIIAIRPGQSYFRYFSSYGQVSP